MIDEGWMGWKHLCRAAAAARRRRAFWNSPGTVAYLIEMRPPRNSNIHIIESIRRVSLHLPFQYGMLRRGLRRGKRAFAVNQSRAYISARNLINTQLPTDERCECVGEQSDEDWLPDVVGVLWHVIYTHLSIWRRSYRLS